MAVPGRDRVLLALERGLFMHPYLTVRLRIVDVSAFLNSAVRPSYGYIDAAGVSGDRA
jgi:hypothetical protein